MEIPLSKMWFPQPVNSDHHLSEASSARRLTVYARTSSSLYAKLASESSVITKKDTAWASSTNNQSRSCKCTFTIWPASLPIAFRVPALIGSICRPSPIAMNEALNGWPSILPLILTSPLVPKNFVDSGQTT